MNKYKMKNVSHPIVQFIYSNSEVKCYKIDELSFDEKSIIEGSIYFYNDPEPCMIHKGAVITRYISEINQWIETLDSNDEHAISKFPKDLIDKISSDITKNAIGFKIIPETINEK